MSARAAERSDPDAASSAGRPPASFGAAEAGPSIGALAQTSQATARRPEALARPITELDGIGPKLAAAAAAIGIKTFGDLIEHVPHNHQDRAEATPISNLVLARESTIVGSIRSSTARPTRRRGLVIVEAVVADETGPVKAIWFNQRWLAEKLQPGVEVVLNGSLDRRGFKVSGYEILEGAGAEEARPPSPLRASAEPPPGIHTRGLVPIHPAGEGLRTQRLREWIWQALSRAGSVAEPLPSEVRVRRGFCGATDARLAAHFPRDTLELDQARRRLAYEELFLHQAALLARRQERRSERAASRFDPPGELVAAWLDSLPFEPTADQLAAFDQIEREIQGADPMQRLLMGEVGSGKTVVALYAMLRAVESGLQAALMAPTETLAEQHFATLETLLAGMPLPATLLTGSSGARSRRETLARLGSGELGLIVGTHALIEPSVEFARLGLVVIDEQHRFGVRQRAALDEKGPGELAPHSLHMTATPIPRTLSLTAYGDLDVTTLKGLPAGRMPVQTWVVGEERREGAYGFIADRLREGRQAYVVCPLVNESEADQAKAATAEAERLAGAELAEFEIEVLHGQMPSAQKSVAMERFNSGQADVLVATSVIEVGIDVPNASVMLIEDADRYGLSQLHQLRGRIGRGAHESHCILFAQPRGERAAARLDAIAGERDGFRLAEVDLSLRGEGEVLGTRQSGMPRFKVAVLPEDVDLLTAAREDLVALADRYGTLDAPELGPLQEIVRDRFGDERVEPIAA